MSLDPQVIRHDVYYGVYLPAILGLHERLSTKAVLRRLRENAAALKKVVEGLDADKAANGRITDMDLADEYDHKEDLNGGLLRILKSRGVEICDYCLLVDGWHEKGCREALVNALKR